MWKHGLWDIYTKCIETTVYPVLEYGAEIHVCGGIKDSYGPSPIKSKCKILGEYISLHQI